MLERAPACLEQSGRALLRSSRSKVRSKRALHFAFWSHGAGEINLPSWWLSLLQRAPPTTASTSQSIADTAKQCLTAGLADGSFLDFLYPAKTLVLIHKLAIRDATYLRNRRRETRSLARRRYSSEALGEGAAPTPEGEEKSGALALESDSKHAEQLITAIRHGRATEQTSIRTTWSPELRALSAFRERVRNAEIALKTAESASDWDPLDIERAAAELLELSREAVEEHARYLGRQLESRRSRVGIQYFSMAVETQFHLGNKEQALEAYQEALSQHQDHEATPTVVRLAFRTQDWDFGAQAWGIFQQGPHDDKFFWRELNQMKALDVVMCATNLARYIDQHGHEMDETLQTLARMFAVRSIESILQRTELQYFNVPSKLHFDLFLWLEKILGSTATSTQYSMAVRQMLSVSLKTKAEVVAYGAYAVRLYDMMHKNTGLLPEQSIMEDLFKRACQIQHSASKSIFETLKSQYGPPSLRLYIFLLKDFEKSQDVKGFFSAFEEAREHHPVHWTPRLILALLRMYSHRREPKEAQAIFDRIEELTKIKPTAAHYSALITSYVHTGNLQTAKQKMTEMKENGLEPDAYIYRPFLKHYSLRGDRQSLMKFTGQLLDPLQPIHDFVMESFVVATLQDDDLEEARELLERAQDMKIIGSRTRMWNYLLNAYARRRNYRDVQELHARMAELGILEDEMTYAALITSLTMSRRPDRAYEVLFDTLPERGLTADSYLYACVMMGYLNSGKIEQVFEVHERMVRNGVRADFSIKTIIIKATAMQDLNEADPASLESMVLERAERALAETLETSEPKDLALMYRTPQLGSRTDPFDEVYAAANFQYLVSLYGANRAIDRAAAVYDRYVEFASAPGAAAAAGSPPRKLLAGLMNLFRQGGQHDEVERCWALAREKARALAARDDDGGGGTPADGWVLPARRHVLAAPLHEHMRSLIDQDKLAALDPLFAELRRDGFEPDSRAWNLYVQAHALRSDGAGDAAAGPLRAFAACEAELVAGWPGWPRRAAARQASATIGRLNWLQPREYEAGRRMPAYKTMVVLASAYVRLRERWALQGRRDEGLAALVAAAPNTVREVSLMPRMEEPVQMAFMQGR